MKKNKKSINESLDFVPVSFITLSKSGLIVNADHTAASLLGVSPTKLVQQPFRHFIQKEDADVYDRLHKQLFATEAARACELRLVKSDGKPFCVHLAATLVPDASGAPCIQVMFSDITGQKQTEEALQASEELYRRIVKSAQEGIWRINADSLTDYVNPKMAEMMGYTPHQMLGRPIADFLDNEGRALLSDHIKRRKQGIAAQFEFKYLRKDGSKLWAFVSTNPITNSDGEYIGAVALLTDIGARRATELELAHTSAMLQRTGEMAKIGGWELQLSPQKLYWSRETYRLFEIDDTVVLSLAQAIALYAPEDQSRIKSAVQSAIKDGKPYDIELQVITARGRAFWARSQGSPIIENGKTVKLIGTFQDITERKQAEIKYLQELKFNETLVDHTSVIIVLLNRVGQMVHVNQATVDILGFSRKELLGNTPWALGIMSPEEKVRAIERLHVLLKGGTNPPRESILTAKDGQDHVFSLSSISTRTPDGTIDRIIVSGADLTERNRLQKELLRITEQEQARIGHNLHDGVGQTLTGVATLMDALEFELPVQLRKDAERIRQLVDVAIQEVRRISHGMSPSAVKNRGLAGALQLLSDTIQINHRTACELFIDPTIQITDLEKESQIYRIAQEASNNAIRHGKPSRITISLRRLGDRECVLKVDNNGARLIKSSSQGIGLQIMDYRANLIGGTLNIASKAKQGVSVTCRFPCPPAP